MKSLRLCCMWTVIGIIGIAVPALAHHSFTMFDQDKLIELQGTVAEFYWINPHGHIILKVDPGPGVDSQLVGEWDIECASTNIMRVQGWTSSTLKAGDRVTIVGNPLRNGAKGGSLFYVVLSNGTKLFRDIARPKPGSAP
jgi:hypothetical protein